MEINHRGADIFVAQQFLDRANVGAVFQEMSDKSRSSGYI
jgi:hypothetical protein